MQISCDSSIILFWHLVSFTRPSNWLSDGLFDPEYFKTNQQQHYPKQTTKKLRDDLNKSYILYIKLFNENKFIMYLYFTYHI